MREISELSTEEKRELSLRINEFNQNIMVCYCTGNGTIGFHLFNI